MGRRRAAYEKKNLAWCERQRIPREQTLGLPSEGPTRGGRNDSFAHIAKLKGRYRGSGEHVWPDWRLTGSCNNPVLDYQSRFEWRRAGTHHRPKSRESLGIGGIFERPVLDQRQWN